MKKATSIRNDQFKIALETLKKLIELSDPGFLKNLESEAVLTHWLLAMDIKPPLLPKKLFDNRKVIFSLLAAVVNADKNPIDVYADFQEQQSCFDFDFEYLPFPPPRNPKFKFIDLFAGIGGFRIAMQNNGGQCVFSCEWDKNAQKTYCANYGEVPYGDIRQVNETEIPDHDILCAGFPCQPFSRAGVSARTSLGHEHGFACKTQGTLFFDIVRIVREKQPKFLFLENVANLERHDQGNTLRTIESEIRDLGYSFNYAIINASSVVPQKRRRCYMVCIKKGKNDFSFPIFDGLPIPLRSILEKEVDPSYTISERLWEGHQKRTQRNLDRGTGFTAHLADIDKPSNTIVARYGKDGKECLIGQLGKPPRMLTPRECARLQGFPENFIIPSSRTVAYKQFGNSVAVPVLDKIAKAIISIIDDVK